LCIKSGEFLV